MMQIVQLSKADCPLCGTDGKMWQWNERGGQSYRGCDHKIDRDIFIMESKKLIKKIAMLKARHQEVEEILSLKEVEEMK